MDSAKLSNWDRAWTAEELKESADNWSLAGDVALLNTLKAFSEKLLNQTGEISDKIDTLLNTVDEAGLKLDLAQNEFQNLKNTQFIESRVYDDDETLDTNEVNKPVEVPVPKDEKEKIIITSIKNGMKILEEYYDKFEVSMSDSEDEAETSNLCDYVLKPKDMYAHRPLPPIIGTEEWYKKWHLDIPSSDSESDKVSDNYSDSDSDDNLPKDLIKGSDTSSELDFSNHENRPAANSTRHVDSEASSVNNDRQLFQDANASSSNISFAEQLAAKLGNIISEQEVIPEEVNRRPIQPTRIHNLGGALLDDEPPPLDDFEDTLLPGHAASGYFLGGENLFDSNDEDELFWGQSKKSHANKQAKAEANPKVSKGLFDESSTSDEETFAVPKKLPSSNKYLQSVKPAVELHDEEPPVLQEKSFDPPEESKKKPIGGVRLFGSTDIFNQKTSKLLKGASKDLDNVDKTPPETIITEDSVSKPKRRNLFDEDEVDDFFGTENALFSGEPKKNAGRNRKGLFDDIDDENDFTVSPSKSDVSKRNSDDVREDDIGKLPSTNAVNVHKQHDRGGNTKKVSLFDDDDDLFTDDDFFSNIAHTKLSSKLFEDIDDKSDDLFNIKYEPKTVASQGETDTKGNKEEIQSVEKSLSEVNEQSDALGGVNRKPESLFPNPRAAHTASANVKKIRGLFTDSDSDESVTPDLSAVHNLVANENIVNVVDAIKDEPHDDNIQTSHPSTVSKDKITETSKDSKKKIHNLFGDSDSEENTNEGENISNGESKSIRSDGDEEKSPEMPVEKDASKQVAENVPSSIEKQAAQPEKTRNVVGLFDSVPPIEDYEDWDQKSDTPSDAEEYLRYDADENFNRSSIFDDEPPAIESNGSSGFVKNNTDNSIFISTATSTRRLSADLFSDQQAKDSFVVTKSEAESVSQRTVNVVPEKMPADFTDLTPSGHTNDFESVPKTTKNSEENFSASDKQETEASNVIGRIASIKQSLQSEITQKTSTKSQNSPGKLKLNLNINVNALKPGMGAPKLKSLPKSQSLELPTEDADSPTSDQDYSVSSSKETFSASSGREPNILDGGEEKVEVLKSMTKDRAKIPVKRRPPTRKGRLEAVRRSAAELQFYPEDDVNIVDDKVKKNNSGSEEFKSGGHTEEKQNTDVSKTISKQLKENVVEKKETETQKKIVTENKSLDSGLFLEGKQKTSEISATIPNLDKNIESLPDPKISKEPLVDKNANNFKLLFDGDEASDDEMFFESNTKNIEKPTNAIDAQSSKNTEKKTTKLFTESDDEIFSDVSKKKVTKSTANRLFGSEDESDGELFKKTEKKKPSSKSQERLKKPLFNDSSSDEDLFSSGNGSNEKFKGRPNASAIEAQRGRNLKKYENKEATDDPLSKLL